MKSSELFVLALVLIVVVSYGIVSVVKPNIKDKYSCDLVVDSLNGVNDSLNLRIGQLNDEVLLYEIKLDSLSKVKNKVIVEYISIYEEIDSADADDLADEFKVVFSKHLGQ